MNLIDSWLPLSMLAALFWAVVNLLDKILVIEHIKSQWSRLILDSIVGLTSCALIFGFNLLVPAPPSVILLSLIAGMLLYAFNYLYYKALETADISVTAVLMQTIPLFTALWGFLAFGELFNNFIYLGIGLVILGAILANIEVDKTGIPKIIGGKNWNAAMLYMLPGVFLVSINYALQKYILAFSTTWTVFFWGRIGAVILTTLMLVFSKNIRKDFWQTVKTIKVIPMLMLSGVEWLNLFGIFLIISAYAIGPVTLVATISAIQPLFVIGIVILFSLLRGKSILADFSGSKKILALRIIASIVMVTGIYLISR